MGRNPTPAALPCKDRTKKRPAPYSAGPRISPLIRTRSKVLRIILALLENK